MLNSMPSNILVCGQTGEPERSWLYRHEPTYVSADLDGFLAGLGVRIRKPIGHIHFRRDPDGRIWHEVGRLTIHPHTKAVEVYPRRSLTETEMAVLCGAGANAVLTDPTYLNGWAMVARRREVVWESRVYLSN
ncbi:hypothetical protein ACWIGI_28890 [Nocardia sp. NPDC055321]